MESENKKPLNIVWSNKAKAKYAKLITYITKHFSPQVAFTFDDKVDKIITDITTFEKAYPISKKQNIHKCVLHKKTSMLYTIDKKKNILVIRSFIGNPTHHKY